MVRRSPITMLVMALALALLLCVPVAAADGRVFDYAGVMSADEAAMLDGYLAELRSATGYDFVFLSDTDLAYNDNYDAAERAAIAHADDFYDYGGYGDASNNWSGMIFYLDMSNRIPVITTTGEMIDIINDSRLADLFDIVYNYLYDSDYYGAAYNMFAQAKKFIDAGVVPGQYRYDAGPGGVDVKLDRGLILPRYMREITLVDILIAAGAGFVVALIFYASVGSKYNLKGSTYSYDLLNNTKVEITESSDIFIRETVTRVPRNTDSGGHGGGGRGSGTHISSSGRSHGGGGGGRRF